MATEQLVVIGAGLAGATAAATLRAEGFGGAVVIVGNEGRHPYIRPPLSKGFLAGTETEDSLLPYPARWYADNDVRLVLDDAARAIDRSPHQVRLASGAELSYDRLLLATGARPRQLAFEGSDLAGVHLLRTLDQSRTLHAALAAGGRHVVLIGSGWIGMEVAATARQLGNEVTLLGLDEVPLSAALGNRLGAVFAARHKRAGVHLLSPASVARATGNGSVAAVETTDGQTLPADIVIVAVGVLPNTTLAEEAGLAVRNGILVDAGLRSSDPDIFAAGDVANALHPVTGEHARSEHWANAIAGGTVAGRSMLGQAAVLDDIPYFYTDQFDLGMEYSGFAGWTSDAELVLRGNPESNEFVAFWLRNGALVAGMNVNVWDVQDAIKDLIRSGRILDPARLADSQIPLEAV